MVAGGGPSPWRTADQHVDPGARPAGVSCVQSVCGESTFGMLGIVGLAASWLLVLHPPLTHVCSTFSLQEWLLKIPLLNSTEVLGWPRLDCCLGSTEA